MRDIKGKPRFNAIQLHEFSVKRDRDRDHGELVVLYYNKKKKERCGHCTFPLQLLGKKSLKLLSELCASIEADAARVLFNEPTEEDQTQEEGIHEPAGLAEGEKGAEQL